MLRKILIISIILIISFFYRYNLEYYQHPIDLHFPAVLFRMYRWTSARRPLHFRVAFTLLRAAAEAEARAEPGCRATIPAPEVADDGARARRDCATGGAQQRVASGEGATEVLDLRDEGTTDGDGERGEEKIL